MQNIRILQIALKLSEECITVAIYFYRSLGDWHTLDLENVMSKTAVSDIVRQGHPFATDLLLIFNRVCKIIADENFAPVNPWHEQVDLKGMHVQ